ncbi:MAG TPA: TetR/AcrR family transcriptional regulator [Iamia sp.]|nr:TetR/AcrR family transcriptional regulator [Iamia sp.]
MPAGLRERKKAETRQAISAAALDLALTHGPGGVTVDDIAAEADVSPRTVFNYFATKEEAILGVDPERRADILDRLAERPADEPPLMSLRYAMRFDDDADRAVSWRTRARLARDHPQLQSAYVASFASLENDLTVVLAGRLDLDPRTDPYPRLVVAVALAALRVAVQNAIDIDQVATLTDVLDRAFAAVAVGLPAPRNRP